MEDINIRISQLPVVSEIQDGDYLVVNIDNTATSLSKLWR